MQFSDRTIEILKNFSAINPGIQFRSGNVLKTITSDKTLFAQASLQEDVEQDFCIYDLSRFLGIISTFQGPIMNLKDSHVLISGKLGRVSYKYARPETIILPPEKDINLDTTNACYFPLTVDNLKNIFSISGIMGLPDITICGREGQLSIRVNNAKEMLNSPDSDCFQIDLGPIDREFECRLKKDTMKILPDNYDVTVTDNVVMFKSNDLTYWMACETK